VLKWHTDMAALRRLNRANLASWYPLPTLFDPELDPGVDESNTAWIEAADRAGGSVAAIGLRLFDWPNSDFGREFEAGRVFRSFAGEREVWQVTAPSAALIGGRVFYPGTLWIRPDHRGRQLGGLLCHLAIALAWTKWSPDWAASVIGTRAVERGAIRQYGLRHIEWAVTCRDSPRLGNRDLVLGYLPRAEFRDEIETYLRQPLFTVRTTETSVATGSPQRVCQGRMSLS
jgi:hypothetical protein